MSWPSDFSDLDSFICSDVLEMEKVSFEHLDGQQQQLVGTSEFQCVLVSSVSSEAAGAFLESHIHFVKAEFPACIMVLL